MKRGEIRIVSNAGGYAGKPRPAVLMQDDTLVDLPSATVCLFTTHPPDAPLLRPLVEPTASNGLRASCRITVDKIITVPKAKIGERIGVLDAPDLRRLDQALLIHLGFAGLGRAKAVDR